MTREQLRQKRTLFWSEFKAIMSPIRSVNGRKMNWLNYPTDVRDVYLRLEADKSGARLCFDIQPKDEGVRAILWEQMGELRAVMEETMGTHGVWIEHCSSPSIPSFSRIQWENSEVNFFNEDDKHAIFAFFREHLVKFDAFYQDFNAILINLAD